MRKYTPVRRGGTPPLIIDATTGATRITTPHRLVKGTRPTMLRSLRLPAGRAVINEQGKSVAAVRTNAGWIHAVQTPPGAVRGRVPAAAKARQRTPPQVRLLHRLLKPTHHAPNVQVIITRVVLRE